MFLVNEYCLSQIVFTGPFVLSSSMGGTDPNNFLNKVGKNPDGSGNGDILLWKRKAEKYLIDVSCKSHP